MNNEDAFPTMREMECQHIRAALRFFNYDRVKTAKALGISKPTLDRKIGEFELSEKDESALDDVEFELNRPVYAWERD